MARTLERAEADARKVANGTTIVNASIAWVPFSTVVLTLSEGWMVREIGRAFEIDASDGDITSILSMASASVVGHSLGEWTKAIGIGFVAHPVIAGCFAKGIAEIAIAYFKSRTPLPSGVSRPCATGV